MSFTSSCSNAIARALNSQTNLMLPFLTMDEYLAIDSGGHLRMNSLHTLPTAGLNTSKSSSVIC